MPLSSHPARNIPNDCEQSLDGPPQYEEVRISLCFSILMDFAYIMYISTTTSFFVFPTKIATGGK